MGIGATCTAAVLAACLACAETPQNVYLIDTFDTPHSLATWHVSGNASLELGSGYRGHGAVLRYRADRENDVLVTWRSSVPAPKVRNPVVSLWARFPSDVQVTLQVEDTGGKKIQVSIEPTLEHPLEADWRYASCPLKHQIASLALSIRTRTGAAVQGEVDYDEITIRSSDRAFRLDSIEPDRALVPKTRALPAMGVNIHLLRDEPSLDSASAAGFTFARIDLLWSNVERRGRFRFFAYDFLLRALEARGMSVLWILDYGHPDHGGAVPRTSEDIQAFSRFAQAVAEHYRGRNVRYEIWNEPNNPQFWASAPNPVEYRALLKEALTAMRSADPSAVISSGGVSNLDLFYLSRVLDPSLASMLTAISVHPYPKNGPESIVPAYSLLRSWMTSELGEHLQVWDSEWGYSSTLSKNDSALNGHNNRDRERQANLAIREILTAWGCGFPLAVWYDLRDDGSDPVNPEQNYGLLDSTGHEKPAMQAVRNLMNAARARKLVGMLPEPPSDLHGMRFAGDKDTLLVVWTDNPERDRTLEVDRRDLISATDILGRVVRTKSQAKDYLRVKITERTGPIYLLFRTGSPT